MDRVLEASARRRVKVTTGRAPHLRHVWRMLPEHASFAQLRALLEPLQSYDTGAWAYVDADGDQCELRSMEDWHIAREAAQLRFVEMKQREWVTLDSSTTWPIRFLALALAMAVVLHPQAALILVTILAGAAFAWRALTPAAPVWHKKQS